MHKCKCSELLEDISFTGSILVWLSHKERATLYACTSRDCSECGKVIVIPHESKED